MPIKKHSVEKRISKIRKLLKISQSDFARKINITQGALSQIENEKIHISVETLYQVCDHFNVSADWLIYGRNGMFRSQKLEKAKASPSKKIKEENKVVLIDVDAHADYLTNFGDEEYINSLDAYRIPGFVDGNFRMFEITGDSMEPSLYEGEIVVVEQIEDISCLGKGELCVLVTNDGIIVKKLYLYEDGYKALILKSDNQKYKSYKLSKDKILEVWEVKAKITSAFLTKNLRQEKKYIDLEERIKRLEKELDKIKNSRKDE